MHRDDLSAIGPVPRVDRNVVFVSQYDALTGVNLRKATGLDVKLGDVIKKEREGKTGLNRHFQYTVEEISKKTGVSPEEWRAIEAGDSPVEKWFPVLCQLAVKLKIPTSRLLAKSGKSKDTEPGQAAKLIREHREDRGHTVEEMAALVELAVEEYLPIEKGQSPIETVGPMMLHFAELIEQPVFNLYLPCGVLYSKLDDYP